MPGGDRGVRLIPPLVPGAAGVGTYGAIDAAGLCEALMRGFDRDLIRGGHYGQRSWVPRKQAEHMAAPTIAAK